MAERGARRPGPLEPWRKEKVIASTRNMPEYWAKQAKLQDERAARAEIRRVRALKMGNKQEAEGAVRTIAEAKDAARHLRAKIV